jgi:HicB family
MPGRKRTGLITTNIRLPQALHKKLTQRAAQKGVPLNTLLIERLEDYDARLVKRLIEIIQPLLDEAIMKAAQMAGHIVTEVTLGKGNEVTLQKGNEVTLGKGNEVTLGKGNEVTLGKGNAAELRQRLARVGILMQEAKKSDKK